MISTLDFTLNTICTLYTTTPHNLLNKVLPKITKFVFKSKTYARISISSTFRYWTPRDGGKRYLTEATLFNCLIPTVSYLITKCYVMIGNTAFKENVGISMGIDSPPFCANVFPYFLSLNMSNKLFFLESRRACRYFGTSIFIDDPWEVNVSA